MFRQSRKKIILAIMGSLILLFVVIVIAFNIFSSLTMLIIGIVLLTAAVLLNLFLGKRMN